MRRATVCILDEEDYELAAAIQNTGLHKSSASILVYLLRRNSGTQRDIQEATRLLQPEASIYIKPLIEKGWVLKKEIQTPGKGRPHNVYSLGMPPADLLETIETELEEKLSEEQTRIASLVIKLREARKSMEG
jgi:predicted transcriptional regulator